jgi:hypothetical protein
MCAPRRNGSPKLVQTGASMPARRAMKARSSSCPESPCSGPDRAREIAPGLWEGPGAGVCVRVGLGGGRGVLIIGPRRGLAANGQSAGRSLARDACAARTGQVAHTWHQVGAVSRNGPLTAVSPLVDTGFEAATPPTTASSSLWARRRALACSSAVASSAAPGFGWPDGVDVVGTTVTPRSTKAALGAWPASNCSSSLLEPSCRRRSAAHPCRWSGGGCRRDPRRLDRHGPLRGHQDPHDRVPGMIMSSSMNRRRAGQGAMPKRRARPAITPPRLVPAAG